MHSIHVLCLQVIIIYVISIELYKNERMDCVPVTRITLCIYNDF